MPCSGKAHLHRAFSYRKEYNVHMFRKPKKTGLIKNCCNTGSYFRKLFGCPLPLLFLFIFFSHSQAQTPPGTPPLPPGIENQLPKVLTYDTSSIQISSREIFRESPSFLILPAAGAAVFSVAPRPYTGINPAYPKSAYANGNCPEKKDNSLGITFFGGASYGFMENDSSALGMQLDGASAMAGVNIQKGCRYALGLCAGYENLEGDTDYNRGDISCKGSLFAPILAIRILDHFVLDALYGMGAYTYEASRTGGLDIGEAYSIRGETDAKRRFGASHLHVFFSLDRFNMRFFAGYRFQEDEMDPYTETSGNAMPEETLKMRQIAVGADISYCLDKYEPYFTFSYEKETSMENIPLPGHGINLEPDCQGYGLSLGTRFLLGKLQGDIRLSHDAERDDFANTRFSFLLGYIF